MSISNPLFVQSDSSFAHLAQRKAVATVACAFETHIVEACLSIINLGSDFQ